MSLEKTSLKFFVTGALSSVRPRSHVVSSVQMLAVPFSSSSSSYVAVAPVLILLEWEYKIDSKQRTRIFFSLLFLEMSTNWIFVMKTQKRELLPLKQSVIPFTMITAILNLGTNACWQLI